MKIIRVVVIDDSAYNRRTIIKMLEEVPNVKVVAYAADGEEGIRKIIDLKPDLVTLDLEMPKMDGFTLLRIIMNSCPTPVIVISSRSGDEQVFKAMELGAVDFIAKPGRAISDQLFSIQKDLQQKVSNVLNLNMDGVKRRETILIEAAHPKKKAKAVTAKPAKSRFDVVAIGASTGGPPALQGILTSYAERPPVAILISQHMPAGFTKAFAERLNRLSVFDVKEAADGDAVKPGNVLVAPGGHNMIFQRVGDDVVARIVAPSPSDRYIPSVDAMFLSLAPVYGKRLMAVVLTGMGNDGSRGIKAVKGAGGETMAEAEESSVVFGMPREAIATGMVDRVVPLDRVAREIITRCGVLPNID
jgi:two-component system chemotaxis response regulator CheB